MLKSAPIRDTHQVRKIRMTENTGHRLFMPLQLFRKLSYIFHIVSKYNIYVLYVNMNLRN